MPSFAHCPKYLQDGRSGIPLRLRGPADISPKQTHLLCPFSFEFSLQTIYCFLLSQNQHILLGHHSVREKKNFLISLLHRHLTKIVLLSLLADTDHDLPESCGYTTSINRHAKNQSHAKTVTNLPHESRLDTRYYFNVRSKAEISQLIICHTEPTTKKWKTEKLESKKGIRSAVSVNSPGNPWSQS